MIKACLRTLLVMLLTLLLPASAQQSMDDIFARMDQAEETGPAKDVAALSGDREDAERIDSLFQRGVAQYEQGDYENAVLIFNAVLAMDEYNAGALSYKKRAMQRIGAKADDQRVSARA
jgi:tetratricopeptide (TPR) repeat protein